MEPLLVRHLKGESTPRHPVWLMRQAGRYSQRYRDIRAESSFWEMVSTPELAAKVSLIPIDEIGSDAVIFFSDILTPAYGFGLPIELREAVGPVNQNPIRTVDGFKSFANFDPTKHTKFVGDAFQLILNELDSEKALIGFAGAPWTVAAYLITDNPKTKFDELKEWALRDPQGLAEGLREYGRATKKYLKYQLDSGAHAVQLFDTWASEIPREFFENYYLEILHEIFDGLSGLRIYFPKGAYHVLDFVADLKVEALGVDPMVSLSEFNKRVQGRFALQGNLDPLVLLNSEENVRAQTRKLVEQARKVDVPVVLNLGHGVRKQTPVANVKAFVEEAKKPF